MIRRLRRIDPLIWDRVLAGLLALGGTIEVLATDELRSVAAVLGVLAVSATLLLRRVRPLAAPALWLAGVVFLSVTGSSPDRMTTPFLTMWILPYAIGNRLPLRPALLGLALMWAGLAVSVLQIETRVWGDLFFPGAFASTFWFAGRVVRSRSRLTAELHEVTVQAGEAREGEAARAVAEERRRIAREMHDVVAHSVSMMVVQAGGARRILDRDPARAVAAAELIERTGREALVEMRTLLGVLHAGRARRARAAADAARARRPGRAHAARRRPRLAVGRGREARAARRPRPRGLPRRPGGADQCHQARGRRPHGGSRALPCRRRGGPGRRPGRRRPQRPPVRQRPGSRRHARARADVRRRAAAGRLRGGGFEVHVRLPLEGEEDAALTAGARA